MIRRRIYSYAPEHRTKFRKALIGVVYAAGRPVDPTSAFSLHSEIEIEDQPWPYVRAPDSTEARCWAIAVRCKPKLKKAHIDFDCDLFEQERLIEAIVQHPDLKHLSFGQECRFDDRFFMNLGYHVHGLESLVINQRLIAYPYCTDANACDTFVALAIRNSSGTLRDLEVRLSVSERSFRAIGLLEHLRTLTFRHMDVSVLDLTHVQVDVLTLYMCREVPWDEIDLSRVKRLSVHETSWADARRRTVEMMYSISDATQTLEHFDLAFATSQFPHELFIEIVVPGIMESTSLRSFSISKTCTGLIDVHGFEKVERVHDDLVMYTRCCC